MSGQQAGPLGVAVREAIKEIHGSDAPGIAGSGQLRSEVCTDEWFLAARVAARAQDKIRDIEGMDRDQAYAEAWREADSFCDGALPIDLPAVDAGDVDQAGEETRQPDINGEPAAPDEPTPVTTTRDVPVTVEAGTFEVSPEEGLGPEIEGEIQREMGAVTDMNPTAFRDGTEVATVAVEIERLGERGPVESVAVRDIEVTAPPPAEVDAPEDVNGWELIDGPPVPVIWEGGPFPNREGWTRFVVIRHSSGGRGFGVLKQGSPQDRPRRNTDPHESIDQRLDSLGAAINRAEEFMQETPPREPEGPPQPPIELPETVGDYTQQRPLNPDEGHGFGTAVYTGNGEFVDVRDRQGRSGWEVDVRPELSASASETDTLARDVSAEDAKEVALDYMTANSAPSEVNGWRRVPDIPGIEFQTPDGTALAMIEETGDDQFRVAIQRDELSTERITLEPTRADAIDRLVDALERRDPEGYGLADEEGRAAGQTGDTAVASAEWTADATEMGDPIFRGETPDGEAVEAMIRNGRDDGFEVTVTVRGDTEVVATADMKGEAVDALRDFKDERTPAEAADMVLDTDFADERTEGQASLSGESAGVGAAPSQSPEAKLDRLDKPDEIAGWELVTDGSPAFPASADVLYRGGPGEDGRLRWVRILALGRQSDPRLKADFIRHTGGSDSLDSDEIETIATGEDAEDVDRLWDEVTEWMREHPVDERDDGIDLIEQQTLGDEPGQASFDIDVGESDPEVDQPESDADEFLDTREAEEPEREQGSLDVGARARRDPGTAGLGEFGDEDDADDADDAGGDSGNGDGGGESSAADEFADDLRDRLRDEGLPGQGANALARRFGSWDELMEQTLGDVFDIPGVGPTAMGELVDPAWDFRTQGTTVGEARERGKPGGDDDDDDDDRTEGFEVGDTVDHPDHGTGEVVGKSDIALTVEFGEGGITTPPQRVEKVADADAGEQDEQEGEEDPQEAALDRMVDDRAWDAETIREAFGVTANVADTLADFGNHPSALLKWQDNFDSLTEIPGVGDESARKLREGARLLESRGLTKGTQIVDKAREREEERRTTWADAVEYVREWYGDSYKARVNLGSDLGEFQHDYPGEWPSAALSSEATLQPLIRYQDIPPEDVRAQIANKFGDDDADAIVEVIRAFARLHQARGDATNTVSFGGEQGGRYSLPRNGNGWRYTDPVDDPAAGPGQGPTTRARWERGDELLAIQGRGTNHRLFYWSDVNEGRASRQTVAGPVGPARPARLATQIVYGDESQLD